MEGIRDESSEKNGHAEHSDSRKDPDSFMKQPPDRALHTSVPRTPCEGCLSADLWLFALLFTRPPTIP